MKIVSALAVFALLSFKNCLAQEAKEDFVNKVYRSIVGSSSYYLNPNIDEVNYRDYSSKLDNVLPQSVAKDILNNAPTKRSYIDWDCTKLQNAMCVGEDTRSDIKKQGNKLYHFEPPVFSPDGSYAIMLTSMATEMHGSHWLYVFKKGKKKWKTYARVFLWMT